MTENRVLEAIRDYIKEITADELLKSPDKKELVPPIVVVGYLPPKNFLPEGYDIPCIVVGMAEGQDDGEEASVHIRITFTTYDDGDFNAQDEFTPDMKGYIDLLHLMSKVRVALLANRIIKGITAIQTPITWKMYDEQPWPLFCGYMEFDAAIAVQRIIETNRDMNLEGWKAHISIPAQGIGEV